MENPEKNKIADAFAELEKGIYAALETYSNVHRGSGHNSIVSTHLYEQAREIVLEYLDLNKSKYTVIFCSKRRAEALMTRLDPINFMVLSSHHTGLPLGVMALAVNRKSLPKGAPFHSGGGTSKLISKEWIVWADAPDRFEAGTPAIINVIAFAKALVMIQQYGKDIFLNPATENLTAAQILYHDDLEKYSGSELLNELRKTQIGRGTPVPTMEGTKPYINLDNSASTPALAPVWKAFQQTYRQSAQVKQEVIKELKSICAEFLVAPQSDYEVIFTSNATEALNLAAESFSRESEVGIEPVVVNTFLEHSSNDLPWRLIPGHSLVRLSINNEGFIDLNELETLLIEYNQKVQHGKKRIRLVAVSGASNVLGICNDIAGIGRIVHQYGARLLVDASQMAAHRKTDMKGLGIDYLAFSAHKVYAPFGCGVLAVRKGMFNFNSSEMELIRSSGEENSPGIAALGKALVLLQRIGMDIIGKEEQVLTIRALKGMAEITGIKIFGIKDPDSPEFTSKIGVIPFSMKGMMPNKVATELALQRGIGIRYGCHCSHILVKRILNVPPSLERFQRFFLSLFPKVRFPGIARVSLGLGNTEEDIDTLIQVLTKFAKKAQSSGDKHYLADGTTTLTKAEVQKQIDDFVKAAIKRVYS
jgi:selenocysteine lyase/cysteine desulfurase